MDQTYHYELTRIVPYIPIYIPFKFHPMMFTKHMSITINFGRRSRGSNPTFHAIIHFQHQYNKINIEGLFMVEYKPLKCLI